MLVWMMAEQVLCGSAPCSLHWAPTQKQCPRFPTTTPGAALEWAPAGQGRAPNYGTLVQLSSKPVWTASSYPSLLRRNRPLLSGRARGLPRFNSQHLCLGMMSRAEKGQHKTWMSCHFTQRLEKGSSPNSRGPPPANVDSSKHAGLLVRPSKTNLFCKLNV